ncbi:MAG TPA: PAS domain S-box protein, partial [Candidatus Brocadiaceae bacterium]|nr:PAS domain S-box protein [Candidatus Brocadiaceae bacterium]
MDSENDHDTCLCPQFESEMIRERIRNLHENTDFSQTLFQHLIGYAIIVMDFDGNITAFNRGAELILGCMAVEVVGKKRIDALLPGSFIEHWESQGIATLLCKERFSCEIEISRKSGERFSGQLLFTLTKDRDGKAIGFVLIIQDLTERMLAAQTKALQQIVERYKVLVETSPEVLMLLDSNMTIIICSSLPGAALFGYAGNPKEIIGKSFFEFINPSDYQYVKGEIASVRKIGSIRSVEHQFIRKDGTTFFGEMSVSVFMNPQGMPDSYIVVVRDITQRRKIEQAHARLVSIVEATSDFIGIADAKTARLLYINKEGRKMCGIGEDEDITRLKITDVYPEWANKLLDDEVIPTAIRHGIWKGECAFQNRDGLEIPVSMIFIAHKTSSGEVEYFSTISRNITERKYAEKTLQENEEKFRSIYEGSNDAIMLLTEKGFFDCNERTLEIFGLTSNDEFVSLHASQLSPPLQPDGRDSFTAANEKIATAFKRGMNRFEWMYHRKSGEDFPAEVLLSAFNYKGKKILQATVRDISERKKAENNLLQSYERLRRTLEETATALASALEMRDAYTAGHQRRVSHLACVIAGEMGLSEDQINGIRM